MDHPRRPLQARLVRQGAAEAPGARPAAVAAQAPQAQQTTADCDSFGHGSCRGDRRFGARHCPGNARAGAGQGSHGAVERLCPSLPPVGLQAALWGAPALLHPGGRRPLPGLFVVCGCGLGAGGARRLDRLDRARPGAAFELGGGQYEVFALSLGPRSQLGQQGFVAGDGAHQGGLAAALRLPAGAVGNLCGGGTLHRDELPGGQLDPVGNDGGTGAYGSPRPTPVDAQGDLCVSADARFPRGASRGETQRSGGEP